MNVARIIEKYLRENGFDGLCCEECGCGGDDLFSCCCDGGEVLECKPAIKVLCDRDTCPNPYVCPGYDGYGDIGDCYRPKEVE